MPHLNFSKIKKLHNLLEQRALISPNNVALRFYETTLTYLEYNNLANQIARYLIAMGVKKGDIVCLYIDRCLELPVVVMATLKCGAVCVPLDITSPPEKIKLILSNAQPNYIFVHQNVSIISKKEFSDKTIINYEKKIIANYSKENLNIEIQTTDLAFILYTSGSTGEPKGAELEHQGFVNLSVGLMKLFFIEQYNMLQISSVAYDAFIFEIITTICTNGTLILVKIEDLFPIAPLVDSINNYNVNILLLTPSVLKLIQNEKLNSLNIILIGGEECCVTLANDLSKKYRIFNLYGPTETSIVVTSYEIDKIIDSVHVSIGKPMYNIDLKILNGNLTPVDINKIGELYIGGVAVARGYHNNPELTKKNFVYINNKKFYKTGDLVKLLADENLVYIGRIDRQIKYRGARIYLEEIEKIVNEHSAIELSAAIFMHDNLIIYAQLHTGKILNSVQLKSYLRIKLPENMLPNKYFFLPKIKLNINGKIDYFSLRRVYEKTISKKL